MSLEAKVQRGISVVKQINGAAPGALALNVTLTDQATGDRFWTNSRDNFIMDITNAIDPIAGLQYFLTTQRNGKERKRWFSSMLLTTFNGAVRPGFPVFFGKGQVSWVMQQTLGALTAQNFLITLQHEL